MGKHISFELIEEKPKTKVWAVVSVFDKSVLGKVLWYPQWRQYVFEPTLDFKSVWSNDCLDELGLFIWEKMREHKIDKEIEKLQ